MAIMVLGSEEDSIMIFYIVRHGKPDYATNTLLPEGKIQAELVGERLARLPIDRIYSSPYGRAIETAEPLAKKKNLPMIGWKS